VLSECNLLIEFRRFPENSQEIQKIVDKGRKGKQLRSPFSPLVVFYGGCIV
jgi:hypothetical protein